jgi:hypothetical protein
MAWRILSTGVAVLAAAVATKVVTKGWEVTTGRPAPGDPNNPAETDWKEALVFAALTGIALSVVRVAVTRKAAQYYERSAGHLPEPMLPDDAAEKAED